MKPKYSNIFGISLIIDCFRLQKYKKFWNSIQFCKKKCKIAISFGIYCNFAENFE